MEGYHKPVLLKEVLALLSIAPNSWYLDATLGDGGYSLEILKRQGLVVSLDVDPQAIDRAGQRFREENIDLDKFKLIQGNFRDLISLTQTEKQTKFKGVVFDLGVSSLQLENSERGFSFNKNGPLDMRMDPTLEIKALDLIKVLNKGELYEIFNQYGEDHLAKRFAQSLVRARALGQIQTTKDLADLAVRVAGKKEKIHPATRIFQALRIAVNDEINALKEALPAALEVLDKDGLLLVVSFHSLEDRTVKDLFRSWHSQGLGQILTKKPVIASEDEVLANPRSRSAKLRVFKRRIS